MYYCIIVSYVSCVPCVSYVFILFCSVLFYCYGLDIKKTIVTPNPASTAIKADMKRLLQFQESDIVSKAN